MRSHRFSVFLLLFALLVGLSRLAIGAQAQIGRSAAKTANRSSVPPLDYLRDIKPLLTERCYACHGNGSQLGKLRLDNRSALLKGGQSGPAVVVGHAERSLLIKLVSGGDPGRIMPARGKRLSSAEIARLRAWIDQGLPFDAAGMQAAWQPPLAPRRPNIPAASSGSGLINPIDRILQPYFTAHNLHPGPVVSDRIYARRVYLDLVGMLPTPVELHAFLNDTRLDKRARLVQKLLSDNRRYAEHWMTFWNDMLRNDYTGTGYIDGGRTQITDWLYAALAHNMPYDHFVAELVNPTPRSAGFVNGIVWRGVVNASQTPQMQAAQNISQVFLGINLKCASCHNSFISSWKLADAYGMAGIYADRPLEMVRCDKPLGQTAAIKFLYPELGAIDGSAPREQRMARLAAILTSRADGRLARTLVNRLWAKLMGHGLVEPTDEMDNRPWNPDLLDWLAADFAGNGYDVKQTLARIATSRAYQLPSAGLRSERTENFVFSGPVVKRMAAEPFLDAVSQLTDVWPAPADPLWMLRSQALAGSDDHTRILFHSGLMKSGAAAIDVDITGAKVLALFVSDGGDGADFDWADWCEPQLVGLRGTLKLTELKWQSATTGYGTIQIDRSIVAKPLRLGSRTFANGIGTHANSLITYILPAGYTRFRATAGPDAGALEQPKSKTSIEVMVLTGDRSLVQTRAVLAAADPLLRALDRPNRDQVVTERSTVATTLQALELTNGQTLAGMLEQGAQKWTREYGNSADGLVDALYEQALGRLPTAKERPLALQMAGSPVTQAGVEDLLWALVMLPEFQLIY